MNPDKRIIKIDKKENFVNGTLKSVMYEINIRYPDGTYDKCLYLEEIQFIELKKTLSTYPNFKQPEIITKKPWYLRLINQIYDTQE